MSILFLVFVVLIIYLVSNARKLFTFLRLAYRCLTLLKDVPGPPSIPLLGSAHLFKWDSVEFSAQLEDWGRKYMYQLLNGEVTGLVVAWVGPVPLVFCGTKESIRPILESTTNITKPVQYDILSDWIGTGLLTSTSEKWFTRRKMLTPTFHFNILQDYRDVFSKNGEVLVQELTSEADRDVFFDIFPYMKRCALDIICETAMGTEMGAQKGGNNEYVQAVSRVSAIIWNYQRFPWLWLKPVWYLSGLQAEFTKLVKLTNDFTRNVIQQRKWEMDKEHAYISADEKHDNKKLAFLDLLLKMQKTSQLSDEDIREEVDTFMFEGHDTTASGMGFTIWWLGQTPRCQQLVHKELDDIFGDSDRHPTTEDLKKMVYLEKCIKESLRLTPSVPLLARRLENDVHIGSTILPKDLTVVVCPLVAQRDPRAFEFPEEFYPEHFDAESTAQRDPYNYIPFSAGPRNCIGQKFAILEEKVVLSWFLRRYRVETEEAWPGNQPVPEIVLKPSNGFSVKIFTRRAFD